MWRFNLHQKYLFSEMGAETAGHWASRFRGDYRTTLREISNQTALMVVCGPWRASLHRWGLFARLTGKSLQERGNPMKLIGGLVLAALLCVLPAKADTIDYTFTFNDPGSVGYFSWTLAHDGFILDTPPIFNNMGDCTNCNRYNFDTFVAVSNPSLGGGCVITGAFIEPDYGIFTYFSPLTDLGRNANTGPPCTGGYDGGGGGVLPSPPDQLGAWSWEGLDYFSIPVRVTLTISDAGHGTVPEPSELGLLGLSLLALGALAAHRSASRPDRIFCSSQRPLGG